MRLQSEEANNRVNEIHSAYINTIAPFVSQLETLDGEFPIEIFNEIRSVFGHLSKAHLSENAEFVERNLSKADSHIKRAILDCFKYLCLAYDDKYKEFQKNFRGINLSDVDNGNFITILSEKRATSLNKLLLAKKLELGAASADELYDAFERAYLSYAETYNLVEASLQKLERVRLKGRRDKWLTWSGFLVGLVGLLLTVYSLCKCM